MNFLKLYCLMSVGLTWGLVKGEEDVFAPPFTFQGTREIVQMHVPVVKRELPEICCIVRRGCSGRRLYVTMDNRSTKTYMIRGPESQIRTLVVVEDLNGHIEILNEGYRIPLWFESIVLSPSQKFTYSIPFPQKVNKIFTVMVEAGCQSLPLRGGWKIDYGEHSARMQVSFNEGEVYSESARPEKISSRWCMVKYVPTPNALGDFWGVAELRPKKLALWLCLRKPGKALVRIDGCTMPLWLDYLDAKGERQKTRLEYESDGQPLRLRYVEKETAERLLYPDLNESFDFTVDLPSACWKLLKAVVEVCFLKPEQMRNLSLSDAEKIMETTKVYVDVDLKSLNPNPNGCRENDASEESLRSVSLTDCERKKK